ncbi:hypothetical protein GOP47_0012701 [Adiantum capillus-veneris]|uniref:Uncharacterized protein n=1 Tax=Adiantum capillus-veneris TaxID=13818 RepID=A0A9D4ZGQ7_ADICA|nr:hypothetical protein GOP47_0012701 [Adiantum capillus-veneris]
MEGTLHASPLQKRADCWPWERLLARTREARGRPREQLLTWNQIQGGSSDPRQIVETRARWERALIRSVAPFCIVGSRARNRALWAGKSVKNSCRAWWWRSKALSNSRSDTSQCLARQVNASNSQEWCEDNPQATLDFVNQS